MGREQSHIGILIRLVEWSCIIFVFIFPTWLALNYHETGRAGWPENLHRFVTKYSKVTIKVNSHRVQCTGKAHGVLEPSLNALIKMLIDKKTIDLFIFLSI